MANNPFQLLDLRLLHPASTQQLRAMGLTEVSHPLLARLEMRSPEQVNYPARKECKHHCACILYSQLPVDHVHNGHPGSALAIHPRIPNGNSVHSHANGHPKDGTPRTMSCPSSRYVLHQSGLSLSLTMYLRLRSHSLRLSTEQQLSPHNKDYAPVVNGTRLTPTDDGYHSNGGPDESLTPPEDSSGQRQR